MSSNNIKPIIELFDITEIKKAFEKLEKNELSFRAVLKLLITKACLTVS